jgi:protein-S-isoprenylcysteine O-methyltransferase Ste14
MLYNSLSKIVRRIISIMRESYSALFAIVVGSILVILAVVGHPLFVNLTWSSWGIVLLRLLVASPLIALFVLVAVFMSRQMKKIDDEADKKREASIKTAFKEALQEDRDNREQHP